MRGTEGFAEVGVKGSASDGLETLNFDRGRAVAHLDDPVDDRKDRHHKKNPIGSKGDRGERADDVEDGHKGDPEEDEDLGVDSGHVRRKSRDDSS